MFLLLVSSQAALGSVVSCLRSLPNNEHRRLVCLDNREFYTALKYAEMVAHHECQRAFKNEPWNCSSFSILKEPKIVRDANREAGYVHALSMAAIAHSIIKLCNDGILSETKCNACDGNVSSCAISFAEDFLKLRSHAIGNKDSTDYHNFEAGKLVLQQIIKEAKPSSSCTCHGASGSCAVQTCSEDPQFVMPNFTVVGARLKEKYLGSCLVESNGRTGNDFAWLHQNCTIDDNGLIHSAPSPSHCQANSDYGTKGVLGRECDPNSSGPGSCDNLCSSCGFATEKQQRTVDQKCDCRFEYCCHIVCNTCRVTQTFHTCERTR